MAKHPTLRRVLGAGLLAGAAYAIWRAIEANRVPAEQEVGWEPQPFPFPPQPRSRDGANGGEKQRPEEQRPEEKRDEQPWVEPDGGACPVGYPVKGKLSSGIYHVPGGLNYDRTTPDRCYADERAAEADGLRASKR
jgi:hypothetical protein